MKILVGLAIFILVSLGVAVFLFVNHPKWSRYSLYYDDYPIAISGRGIGYFQAEYYSLFLGPRKDAESKFNILDKDIPLKIYFNNESLHISELTRDKIEAMGGEMHRSNQSYQLWIVRSHGNNCRIGLTEDGVVAFGVGEGLIDRGAELREIAFSWMGSEPIVFPVRESKLFEVWGEPDRDRKYRQWGP